MQKKQKIIFGIFLALFAVPELLWSPVGNFVYEFLQKGNKAVPLRQNFLDNTDNINILSSILFVQLLGLLTTTTFLISVRKNIKNKGLFWVGALLLLILTVIAFFAFGLSVSLRHIGL